MKSTTFWRSMGDLKPGPNRPEWKTLASFFPSLDSIWPRQNAVPMQECSQRSPSVILRDWVAQSKSTAILYRCRFLGAETVSSCFPPLALRYPQPFSRRFYNRRGEKSSRILHPVAAPSFRALSSYSAVHDKFPFVKLAGCTTTVRIGKGAVALASRICCVCTRFGLWFRKTGRPFAPGLFINRW